MLVYMACAVALLGADPAPIIPVVESEWWSVADNPQLPALIHSDKQQPVDFGVWQAADGTWQLWSCIRHTNVGGHTRLFFRWEGESLTDSDWTPMGITMMSEEKYGEAPGGMQAPHVVKLDDRYLMAYGDWNNICFAESDDGKAFTRIVQSDGRTGVFGEGPKANTRDAMLIEIDGLWHCYYTAIMNGKGYGLCRTSDDLKVWSDSFVTSYGGHIGPGPWFNECPHVVEVMPGEFVYFRNQYYGENQTNYAYYSTNPRNFGIDDDSGIVAKLDIAAPEIIHHEGEYYIASLKRGLDGIRIAKLAFYRQGEVGDAVLDFETNEGKRAWTVTDGAFDDYYCDTPHADFDAPATFVIGTSETSDGGYDDGMTGTLESETFTLNADSYFVYVSGGNDPDRLYVALIDADTNKEIARWTGHTSNLFDRHRLDASELHNRNLRIRITDNAPGGWGHINFGGIYTEAERVRVK